MLQTYTEKPLIIPFLFETGDPEPPGSTGDPEPPGSSQKPGSGGSRSVGDIKPPTATDAEPPDAEPPDTK